MKIRLLAISVLAAVSVSADVTEKMSVRLEPGKNFPPELAAKVAEELAKSGQGLSQEVRIKGSRAAIRWGTFYSISDFDGALVTVLDRDNRRYSTVTPDEYRRAWKQVQPTTEPASRPQPRVEMRIDPGLHTTGRTRTILGIQTEEHELTLVLPVSDKESIRAVMSFWCPTSVEKARNAALVELQRYADRAYIPADFVSEVVREVSGGVPFAGLERLLESFRGVEMFLELRVRHYLPFPGSAAKEPVFEMVQEMTELSTTPIDDSAFEVPRDFSPAPIAEVVASFAAAATKPGAQPVKAPVMVDGDTDPERPTLRCKP